MWWRFAMLVVLCLSGTRSSFANPGGRVVKTGTQQGSRGPQKQRDRWATPRQKSPKPDRTGAKRWPGDKRLRFFRPAKSPIRLLDKNSNTNRQRLRMISRAKSEILLSSYIVKNDKTGRQALAALCKTARRGVDVYLLVDWQGTKLPSKTLATLKKAGVHLGVYNPPGKTLLDPVSIQRRMHDKMLIVDGKVLLVGGRNLGDEYLRERGPFAKTDLDVMVTGRSAQDARSYFKSLWDSRRVDATPGDWKRQRKHKTTQDKKITFLHDAPDKQDKAGQNSTRSTFHQILARSKVSITIRTPYLIPTPKTMQLLKEARGRGVRITVYTNSFATRDGWLPQLGYEAYFRDLAKLGIEIHEYQVQPELGRVSLHDKVVLSDGRLALVSSHNVDSRSENINKETGVLIKGTIPNKHLRAQNAALERKSHMVAQNGVVFSQKRAGCGFGCQLLTKIISPLLRYSGFVYLL